MSFESESEGIDLQQYWMTLRRHWRPAVLVFGSTVALCLAAALLQKPVYQGRGQLLLKVDPLSRLTGVIAPDVEPNVVADVVNTEVEVVKSTPLAQDTIAALNLVDETGKTLKLRAFKKRLGVQTVRGTNTISITFKADNAEEAANVVNKLIELYLERNRSTNRAEATAAREFIEKQLPETEFRVERASEALTRFKQKNRFVAADDEAASFSATLQKIEENINETQAALSNSQARTASLQRQLNVDPNQAIPLIALSQAPGVQPLLAEFQNIQAQLALALARYQESAPVVTSLRDKEANVRSLLQQRIAEVVGEQRSFQGGEIQLGEAREDLIQELIKSEVARYGFENQLSTLKNQYSNYRERAVVLSDLEQTQRQLLLNLNAAQSTYETLLKRLQEVRLAENQNIGNAQIIEAALPPEKPVAPRKLLYLAAGLASGFILGILTAFILDYRDNTIKTSFGAREIFGYPLLGVVPAFSRDSGQLRRVREQGSLGISIRDEPHSFVSETYRMVFANLQLFHVDQDLNIVAVTSSIAGEGKSTLAANLALAAAEACNRVLLIDADMRRSCQNAMWKLPDGGGLSDVLAGDVEPQDVIQQVEGLDILLSGHPPSNPLTLLKSKRMEQLIQEFSQSYDFVIIDTPPLLVSADASIIGKMTDGILLTVRPGVVARQNAIRAQELLEQSRQRILGQVVNAVGSSIESDGQFYYNPDYYKNGLISAEKLREN